MSPALTVGRRTDERLPLVLVLVSLSLALLAPRVADRPISRLRTQINDVGSPALARVGEIRLDIALEETARRGYLLSGDPELATEIDASQERRHRAERQLAGLVRLLGTSGSTELSTLEHHLMALDAHLDSLGPASAPEQRMRAVGPRQQLFAQALTAAASLDTAILDAMDARRADITRVERIVSVTTAVLVLLGLGAAIAVARLGLGYRELAWRLAESEAAARRIADDERRSRESSERRRQELERVTDSRARLIRGFTHDVKNPLGAAAGYLALFDQLGVRSLDAGQRTWIERARRSINNALELTGSLLDVARAEAGELKVERQETDITEIVHEVVDAFRPLAGAKRQALDVVLGRLPPVWTDARRVRQVLGNLVSNAVKYTPEEGHIRLGGRLEAQRDGSTSIALDVTDDGPGIPTHRLPELFTEFTRFDPDAADGSGIGLAISRTIARSLGGDILVRTGTGCGSTFSLVLPIPVPGTGESAGAPPEASAKHANPSARSDI